ncbi:MAG: peptidoglycan editing factor PgeF [Bacteroidetes bacterium]|nr:peptidoglycan editing factor PgeF [Bacteroidota bacterium]
MFIIPQLFDPEKVIAAQSTRHGGVSPAPFHSLNLGMSVKDAETNVLKNRELFFGALHIPQAQVTKSHQVHGNDVLLVNTPVTTEGYDGLISNTRGVFLAVSIADCTPILIHDEKNNAVAALHAGWRGTAGKIVSNAMRMMQEHFGTSGKDCKAFIGACISYANFEVGPEVAEHFDADVKRFDSRKQKWFVDLKAANQRLLTDAGIPPENIEISSHCTVADNELFFSHRAGQGNTGRMMAVIGIK